MLQEIEETYEALSVILEDESTFEYVVSEVFRAIDIDKSLRLGRDELKEFIVKVCEEMGMRTTPDDKTIEEVFKDLDEDNSNDIN
jgi:hypothetical protein